MTRVNSPVAIFGYNRKDKLKKCLESLMECYHSDETDIVIFCDGSRDEKDENDVNAVRSFLNAFEKSNCFKSVRLIFRDKNLGLAKSIITGVTQVLTEYDRVIVLEDDLILAKDFLLFMNEALNFYADKTDYGSISAYTFPLKELEVYPEQFYATRKADCWGWGTWKRVWDNADWEVREFDKYFENKRSRRAFERLHVGLDDQLVRQHNGELDAWSARWTYYLYIKGFLTIYPTKTRVINAGSDGSGTNCGVMTDNSFLGSELIDYRGGNYGFRVVPANKALEKAVYNYSKRGTKKTTFRALIYKIVKYFCGQRSN